MGFPARQSATIWLGCLTAVLAILVAAPALGQPATRLHAYRLQVEGQRAARAGDHETALRHLARSFEIAPRPEVAHDLAASHRALSRYRAAIGFLRKFVELRGATLRPGERQKVEALVRELDRKLCRLTIDVEPEGAVVTVDGQRVGTAPVPRPLTFDPGRHVIEVRREGYAPVTRTIELVEGQVFFVTITLEERERYGVVIMTSAAPGATAALRGGELQPLPLTERLAVGTYQVRVVAPNHHPKEETVVIAADDVIRIDVILAPVAAPALVQQTPDPPSAPPRPTPVYRRAWFWVTLGVVAVAGGATGGYFGYRARSGESFDRSIRLR